MADKDGDGPSLELPTLGFGRKRKARGEAASPPSESPADPAAETPSPAPAPPSPAPQAAPPAATPAAPRGDTETHTEERPTEPMPATEPAGRPLYADEATATRVDQERVPAGSTAPDEPAKPRREFSLPSIGTMPAAILTGLLVGVLTVGATWVGLRLCEVVRGTSTCGQPGFLLLLAIVVVMVLVGSALLRAWQVPDPGSTSFLGVGLLTVVALLFLVDLLFNWWMILVIPVVAMLTFALSHWVATAFVDVD